MLELIIGLAIIGITLFVLSLFMKDRFKKVEADIEQLSLSLMQTSYQTNQKLKVLEEELLPTRLDADFKSEHKSAITEKIELLYHKGHSISDISQLTKISEYDIEQVIQPLR